MILVIDVGNTNFTCGVFDGEKLISSSDSLSKGDKVRITLGQGGAEAQITDKW